MHKVIRKKYSYKVVLSKNMRIEDNRSNYIR